MTSKSLRSTPAIMLETDLLTSIDVTMRYPAALLTVAFPLRERAGARNQTARPIHRQHRTAKLWAMTETTAPRVSLRPTLPPEHTYSTGGPSRRVIPPAKTARFALLVLCKTSIHERWHAWERSTVSLVAGAVRDARRVREDAEEDGRRAKKVIMIRRG